MYTCDVGVALIFYELLKPVSRNVALLAKFFRLVFVAIASANMFNHFAPLIFLSGAAYLSAFKPDQLQALALVFTRLRTFGFDVALVFFGFHCLLVGYLIFRFDFFPPHSGHRAGDWGDRLCGQHFGDCNSTRDWSPSLSLHHATRWRCRNITDSMAHHRRRERSEMERAG